MDFLITVVYFALPGVLANMAPVLLKSIPFGDQPIDRGLKWRGQRLLGDHKTYRGFIVAIGAAIIVVWFQQMLYDHDVFLDYSLVNYNEINIWLLGFLFGLGAMIGDSIKSFFKRQRRVPPGISWFPWDQIDAVLGAGFFVYFYVQYPLSYFVTFFFLGIGMHIVFNFIGFAFGWRKWNDTIMSQWRKNQ